MKATLHPLFLFLFVISSSYAQDLHGFELKDGVYHWTGRFIAEGMSSEQIKTALTDHLSINSFVTSVKPLSDNRIAGKVDKLPEPVSSLGAFMYSFGFVAEYFDGEYVVTTKDWVGVSTNSAFGGMVMRLDELISGTIGKNRKERLCAGYGEAQVKMFKLP